AKLGFSLALGAFLAGILISESEYSHQVIADVAPLRDLFASIFFVSIGMLVDLQVFARYAGEVLALAVAIVVVKSLLATIAVLWIPMARRVAVLTGLGLAQVGEFSFVIMAVGRDNGLLTGDRFQIVLAAAVLTLAVTPGLMAVAPALARRFGDDPIDVTERATETPPRVVMIGYGDGGRIIAGVLREVRIPYIVIELDGDIVRKAKAEGESIVFGDATRREILEHAGVEDAQVLLVTISDQAALPGIVLTARDLHPAIEIVVRTRHVRDIDVLREVGADQVIAEEFETAIEIFNRVLRRLHTPRNVIRAQTRILRQEGYLALRRPALDSEATSALHDAVLEGPVEI
ncbi:MAG: NAD-binding protein, partial [Acidobacteriota bacterium]